MAYQVANGAVLGQRQTLGSRGLYIAGGISGSPSSKKPVRHLQKPVVRSEVKGSPAILQSHHSALLNTENRVSRLQDSGRGLSSAET
jgi:hypothetical protein